MNHGNAYITFDFNGRRHEYDGALPDDVLERVASLLDASGLWLDGYPAELLGQAKEERDTLPTALWEIAHAGGTVVQVFGARPSGAILEEDWRKPRIR